MSNKQNRRSISEVEAWRLIQGFLLGFGTRVTVGDRVVQVLISDITESLEQASEPALYAIQAVVLLVDDLVEAQNIEINGRVSKDLLRCVQEIGLRAGAPED